MEAYLDNSATTKMCVRARERMLECIDSSWGNPSSLHEKGIEADMLLALSLKTVAKALSADSKELVFTSGGTESNNLAVFGAAYMNRRKGNRVITSEIEHPSVKKVFERLSQEGFEVIYIGTDSSGYIDMNELEKQTNGETILISIMAVNNEVGTIQPVEEIAKIVKRKNAPALIHVDAVQAFGKIPLNPKRLGVDLMSVSAHKIHGPKGVGALYIKCGTKLRSVAVGGGQQYDIRPGTEPMVAISGFLGAVESLDIKKSYDKVSALRDKLVSRLKEIEGVKINSPENALPYIVNISLEGLRSETVLNFLSDMGIYVSSGSACAKGHKSYVLTAMGLSDRAIDSSLRISLSRFTTEEEIEYFIDAVEKAMKVIMKR